MQDDLDLTVIIPTYNHAKTIVRAVDSVFGQSCSDRFSVVISDDCSSDETVDICIALAKHRPRLTVLTNSINLGVIAHYQKLADMVDTEYLAILEGDDFWCSRTKLQNQINFMRQFPESGVCFTRTRVRDIDADRVSIQPLYRAGLNRRVDFLDLLRDNVMCTFSSCMYRTAQFERAVKSSTRGFDWLVNLQITSQSPALFLDEIGTEYSVSSSGHWSSMSDERKHNMILETLDNLTRLVGPRWSDLVIERKSEIGRAF